MPDIATTTGAALEGGSGGGEDRVTTGAAAGRFGGTPRRALGDSRAGGMQNA